ncbi:MAG: asparagine synthase-related protein [Arenimonas sp.]
MSAIAGFILLDGSFASIETIEHMLASMQHCGPDAQKFVVSENAAFGQAMLATTPEALNEAQPWTDKATGCVVVTDSRLDNREILAASLGLSGRAIDSVGDAELIFAAYQKWGEACPEKLLGDFTFAIWNPKSRQLFCARDPLGVRPFYYHHVQNKIFSFATTSEALRYLLPKPIAFDEGRLADAMTDELEGHDRTSTFYRDVRRLPPAHSLTLRQGDLLKLHAYWQPLQNPPAPFPVNEKQWLDQLEALFVEAVHCRLRSHLPISAMLSGGLDSSSVVAVACKKLNADGEQDLSTFSAISGNSDCAETRAIRLMQSTFALNSTEIDPDKSHELLKSITEQWPHLDEPFEAFNTLVHAQYLRASQLGARIMMDGIDADALLTEGDYLHDLARAGQWRRVWRESCASLRFWGSEASLGALLRPLISEFLVPKIIRRFVAGLRRVFRPLRTHAEALIRPEFALYVDLESRYGAMAGNSVGLKQTEASGRQAYSVMAGSNSVNAIERYHRLASQHGIEPRHPFLDRRLVEFCAWLPLELRLRDGYPKWAMRQAMSERLPQKITWRCGKEHLGWAFNKGLWLQSGKLLTADRLHPWLQKAVLDTEQTRYRELHNIQSLEVVNENHVEPLLRLASVNFWLNRAGY